MLLAVYRDDSGVANSIDIHLGAFKLPVDIEIHAHIFQTIYIVVNQLHYFINSQIVTAKSLCEVSFFSITCMIGIYVCIL